MLEFFINHGEYFTYFGIAIFLILTGGGLPIPEEVPIVAAGVLSSGSEPFLNVWFAYATCLIGALLGDLLVYSIGRYLGHNFLRRHPRFAHWLHEEREKQMEDLIQRHGLKVFFVARFMVGVRAPLYLAAGALRVPWRRFLLINGICATIVVSVVFWLSHEYGRVVGKFLHGSQLFLTAVIAIAVICVLAYFWIRRRRRMLERNVHIGDDECPSDSDGNPPETDRTVE